MRHVLYSGQTNFQTVIKNGLDVTCKLKGVQGKKKLVNTAKIMQGCEACIVWADKISNSCQEWTRISA